MSILSGYKKFKKYIKTSSGFQLQSLWTSANTVEADDKRTIQTKVGAINGISSSETANSAEIAASTALTNKMNGTINNLRRDLGGLSFGQDADGNWGYKIGGADTVTPFKSGITLVGSYPYTTKKGYPNNATHVFTVNATKISGYKKMTEKNFIVETLRAFSGNSGPYNPQVQWTEVSVSKSYDSNNGILTVTATFREPRNGIAETRYEANVYC